MKELDLALVLEAFELERTRRKMEMELTALQFTEHYQPLPPKPKHHNSQVLTDERKRKAKRQNQKKARKKNRK